MVNVQSLVTKIGDNIMLERTYSTSPQYSPPQDFALTDEAENFNYNSSSMGRLVPITDGIVLDTASSSNDWSANSTNSVESIEIITRKGPSAITIIKDDETSSSVILSKDIDESDVSNRDYWGFFYVDEDFLPMLREEECLEIRLETDTSNYIYFTIDREDLNVGWNIITKPISEFEEEGSPTLTTINDISIILSTEEDDTTTVSGDFVFDEQKVVSDSDYYKPFVSGFPDIDEGINVVTIRKFLTSVESVGFNINGIIIVNRDGTRKLFSGATFPSEIKTFQNEFTIVQKNRLL